MAALKLAKLPDRTPVKLTISISPELNKALVAYAETYHDAYQASVKVSELIPAMLECFIASDKGFAKTRKDGIESHMTESN